MILTNESNLGSPLRKICTAGSARGDGHKKEASRPISTHHNLDHGLMMRAVRKHTDSKWILLYIERWLKAPAQKEGSPWVSRDKGTPQGGVISPLLANLFLHYAFDEWMRRNNPSIQFERYADGIIVHCVSERQAKWLKTKIEGRLRECGLELHPQKTKLVYCKDANRKGSYQNESFDFLGYTFRPRMAKSRLGGYFVAFLPAISNKATKEISRVMRRWRIHRGNERTLEELSLFCNPVVRGWINYYGQYYRSALYRVLNILNRILVRWARRKYKRFRFHQRRAVQWLRGVSKRQPELFAHWRVGIRP
jgi:RNA-directed DNA polymerase